MKAMLCREFGPIDNLAWVDMEIPACGPREVRYRTTVATLGFMDTLMVRGLYQLKPPLPYIPGAVSAGVVTEVGPGVEAIRLGQRVTASGYYGAFAEERVVGEEAAAVTPDDMDDAQAAALRLTFTPSYLALMVRARLQAGETLVVTGATGGIGFSAMQLGRHLGARAIGAVGSAEKAAFLREHGFTETIDYSCESFKERVNALTDGRGADVIFEVIGGDIFEQSLRCINLGGRVLVLGFASGRIGEVSSNLALLKNAAIIGSFLGGWKKRDPAGIAAMTGEMIRILEKTGMRTPIACTLPMAQTAEAMNTLLRRNTIGKIMLGIQQE
jgi:NADPH:quinone reductase